MSDETPDDTGAMLEAAGLTDVEIKRANDLRIDAAPPQVLPAPGTDGVTEAWNAYLDGLIEDGVSLEDTRRGDAFAAGWRASERKASADRMSPGGCVVCGSQLIGSCTLPECPNPLAEA